VCAVELLSVDALQEIRVGARSRSSRGCSARVLARSSRNDIVAVKFKPDEKQRERIAHEFPAASQLTHSSQIRLKSVISVRLCRLWLAAADRKRLRGASRTVSFGSRYFVRRKSKRRRDSTSMNFFSLAM
jgi:hypothetical protein